MPPNQRQTQRKDKPGQRGQKKTRRILLEHFPQSVDRLEEAHWFLHQMIMWYHEADPFRFSLNSFIRSLREVDHMLRAELKPFDKHVTWYRTRIEQLSKEEPLLQKLVKTRNLIVHQQMLAPSSKATIGICDLRGIRSGVMMDVSPFIDTKLLAENAKKRSRGGGLFIPDEDQAFGVERRWGIKEWGEQEILELCSKVWLKIASLFDEVLVRFGGVPVQVGLSCLHEQENYRLKLIELGDEPKVRRRKQRYIKRKLAQMAETSKQPEVKKERESH